jgi:hypothetical protein
MRPLCLIVLMLALVAIVAARSINVTWTSYITAVKQQNNGEDTAERLHDVFKERDLGRKYRSVTQCFFLTENRISNYNKS